MAIIPNPEDLITNSDNLYQVVPEATGERAPELIQSRRRGLAQSDAMGRLTWDCLNSLDRGCRNPANNLWVPFPDEVYGQTSCEHAVGQRNQNLNRQNVKCEPGQLFNQFRLSHTECEDKYGNTRSLIQYQFRCIFNHQTGGVTEDKLSHCADGVRLSHISHLDRVQVSCPSGSGITRFHLQNCDAHEGMQYNYGCQEVGLVAVTSHATECNEVHGRTLENLDRYNLQCPGIQVMQSFKLAKCDGGPLMRYIYTCGFFPSTNAPTDAPTTYAPTNEPTTDPRSTGLAWGNIRAGLAGVEVVDISCGINACVARKSDGTGVAWGDWRYGGNASSVDLTDLVDISCGGYACVARKSDGTGLAWGDPVMGGDASSVDLTDLVDISCGGHACVARKEDGTGLGCGASWAGGDARLFSVHLTDLVDISCGINACVARKSDGTGLAWGASTKGGLANAVPSGGDASSVDLTDLVDISCGGHACVARKSDGTGLAWGHAEYGGNASSVDLTDLVDISCGGYACVARKSCSGVTWCSKP